LIAAMSLGTVVVEAAVRSGALNTASWASLVNRTVMGVPGPVTSAPSEGVHELIRSRDAALVTRGSDVLELVSPAGSFTQPIPRAPERRRDRLTEVEQRVLDALPVVRPAPASSVARTAGLATGTVEQVLHGLVRRRFVARTTAGWLLEPDGPVAAGGRPDGAVASGGGRRPE
jgi:DNA processing protein